MDIKFRSNKLAFYCVLVSVVLYSTLPLFFHYGEASKSPFLFNGVTTISNAICCVIFLMWYAREFIGQIFTWGKIQPYLRLGIFLAALGNLDFALYAWSINYIDIYVATVLFETWPFFLILIAILLSVNGDRKGGQLPINADKKEEQRNKIGSITIIPMTLGLVGLAFVVLSIEKSLDIYKILSSELALYYGVGFLAVLSATLAASPRACVSRAMVGLIGLILAAFISKMPYSGPISYGVGLIAVLVATLIPFPQAYVLRMTVGLVCLAWAVFVSEMLGSGPVSYYIALAAIAAILTVFLRACVLRAIASLAGLALVLFVIISNMPMPSSELACGVVLAVLAAILTISPHAYVLKLGVDVSRKINKKFGADPEWDDKLEFSCIMIATVIVKFVGGLVSVVVGLGLEEEIAVRQFQASIVCGLLVTGAGGVVLTLCHDITKKGGNLIGSYASYATPIFSLIWLWSYSLVNVPRIDFLVIGAIIIVAVNLLLHFNDASVRFAYKVLIISLCFCGTVAYFYDGFGLPDYFNSIVVPTTIFILILSFRTDRLVRLRAEEESITFRLFRQFEQMVKQNKATTENARVMQDYLLKVNLRKTYQNVACVRKAYNKLQQYIKSDIDTKDISQIKSDIDTLVYSKQQGVHFGEITVLFMIGIILVCSLLFFMPECVSGWYTFYVKMLAFILSAVILFLLRNILDMQNDRYHPVLNKINDDYSIVFVEGRKLSFEHRVLVIVCAIIILAFAWLFWYKWVAPAWPSLLKCP